MKSFVRVVIRRADGRFLVLREPGRPFWNFPGGKVEPDEKPADAAARELREETSIDAPVASLELIAHGVYDVLGTPWEGFFFFAHEALGECVPERADPPVEWSWVRSSEIGALASLPGLLTGVAEKVEAGGMVTRINSVG
ncbi:MAG TPA: NUDIX hydrolase [Polyangium sp.]|nr:NUDIX hydrolase [Polyangium sp.]